MYFEILVETNCLRHGFARFSNRQCQAVKQLYLFIQYTHIICIILRLLIFFKMNLIII